MARTLMALLSCLTRTCPWVPTSVFKYLIYVFVLLISFSIFSDQRWSLTIENENNNIKTLTAQFIQKLYPGWLELPLTGTNFHGIKSV